MGDLQALVTAVRSDAALLDAEPSSVAERFGVPERSVRAIQQAVRKERSKPSAATTAKEPSKLGHALRKVWLRATERPFIGLVVCFAALALGPYLTRNIPDALGIDWGETSMLTILVLSLAVQIGIHVRHARVATGWWGAGLFVVVMGVLLLEAGNLPDAPATVIFGLLVLCGLYGVLGMALATVGGVFSVRQAERRRAEMNRQQLLNRLFQVREALAKATPTDSGGWDRLPWLAKVRRWWWIFPIVYSTLQSLIFALATRVLDPENTHQQIAIDPEAFTRMPVSVVLIMGVSAVLGTVVPFGYGFLLASWWKATIATVMMLGIGTLFVYYGPNPMPIDGRIPLDQMLISQIVNVLIGTIGGVAGWASEKLALEKRRRENDPEALLDELLELELRLKPKSEDVTVVAVDVAGSTELKRGADPLDAEYSFREYQAMIEALAARSLGKVISTAGDGAIVSFPTNESALTASRAILTELPNFNAQSNRLGRPFRLRIGIHRGHVEGEIDDVQFTRVIDVAAHVEGAAPIDGLALTETAIEGVPVEGLTKMAGPIDGFEVYAAEA